jgi:dienelactone hydrolase
VERQGTNVKMNSIGSRLAQLKQQLAGNLRSISGAYNHSKACCELPPFLGSKYKPKGSTIKIAGTDLEYYTVGKKDARIALICITDIFGILNNTQQGADVLSAQMDCRIVIPDVFRGKPWDVNDFPPSNMDKFQSWISKYNYKTVEPDIKKIMALLEKDGAQKLGIYGFCWAAQTCCDATH